nr:hypothetical protein [Tanacetum cinerariifolium]GEX53285.1 hypothetical protein [Tanacetum cinerariifolium]
MNVDGSEMDGHLEELEQAAKSKIYARMWVVQMESEVTNDNQIVRKLLDVVKDLDKSLKMQEIIDELKIKKGAIYRTEVYTEVCAGVIYNGRRREKVVNMAAGDSADALVCCVEDHIMDFDASFHAIYCQEELERFKLRSSKVRLVNDNTLDIVGIRDVILKTSFGTNVEACIWLRIGINMLASKGNVLDVRKVDMYLCKPGGLRKQKKLSFIMSERTRKLQRYDANLQVKCLKFDNGVEYSS